MSYLYYKGCSDTQIAEHAYEVSFTSKKVGKNTAIDCCLLRCAEVALENGYSFFVIIDKQDNTTSQTYKNNNSTTTFSATTTKDFFGSHTTGTAYTFGGGSYTITTASFRNIIYCLNEKPDGFYYDAKLIKENLHLKYGIPMIEYASTELEFHDEKNISDVRNLLHEYFFPKDTLYSRFTLEKDMPGEMKIRKGLNRFEIKYTDKKIIFSQTWGDEDCFKMMENVLKDIFEKKEEETTKPQPSKRREWRWDYQHKDFMRKNDFL